MINKHIHHRLAHKGPIISLPTVVQMEEEATREHQKQKTGDDIKFLQLTSRPPVEG